MPDHTFPHPAYSRHVLQPAYDDARTYLFQPMLDANRAHALMLYEQRIIDQGCARGLLVALDRVEAEGLDALAYQPGVEDLFFQVENRLVALSGADVGGNLQLGRSRNDLGHALARMALRSLLLDVVDRLNALRATLAELAREHLHTIMPGYTHTQPAQPTTFAHYLAGVLSSLARDACRLRAAYSTVNLSPLGAAAFTGSGFELNRTREAALLGFSGVLASSHDSIGASDYLTETAGVLATLAVNLSRVTHDMLVWGTQESGGIRIHDSFIQISSIMPQKRNPVVLEHLRARLSRLQGACQTVLTQCQKIPYGDTQDIEDEIWPPISQALDTASDILTLYEAVFATLQVNADHLRSRAADGFTTATELADALVREAHLPFRTAHTIVSRLVGRAYAAGMAPGDIGQPLLDEIAIDLVGHPTGLDDATVRKALDPMHFVAIRQTPGGAAPEATAALLKRQDETLDKDRQWWRAEIKRLSASRAELHDCSADLVKGGCAIMKKTADVVVIGGGIMGVSIAYQLALRGMEAILVEKRFLGAGASGRSSAIIRQHYSNETTARMARRSLTVFRNFEEIIGGAVDFEQTGMLFIAPASDRAGMEANVAMQQRIGIDTSVLSGAELHERHPGLAGWQDVVAAWEPDAGYADPAGAVNAFAAAAKRHGAQILQNTEVTGITLSAGHVRGVETSQGHIATPLVVNAAGPWARHVAQMTGIDLPAHACRVQVNLLDWPDGFSPHPIVADFENVVYFRPETGGQTLIGSIDPAEANDRVNPDRYKEGVDFDFVADTAERVVQRYPDLARGASRGGYASLYTITPDWHPILDELPAGSGCFLAVGFSGHGFKLAPAIGEMMADLVTGEAHSGFDLALFRLERFAAGRPVRGQYEYSIIG